jgi:hypothetical protein
VQKPSGQAETEIGATTLARERKNNGYRLGFDEMAKKWVCGDGFFFRGRWKWRRDGELSKDLGEEGKSSCRSFNRGERRDGWRKGEKREGKKGRERKPIVEMREGKKKKKMGRIQFFYSMKSYSSFLFVKSYCSTLAI